MIQRPRLALSWILIGLCLPLTIWGFWPPAREVREVPLQTAVGELALPETRTIRLEFSPAPRLGDSQIMQLRIISSGAVAEDNNIYEEYTVLAEARLDMPLAEVRPAGVVSAPLTAGGSATFYWEVSPRVDGVIEGIVWVSLRFIPQDGGAVTQAETRQAVSAQMLATRPRSALGRTGSQARVGGVVGLMLGILLGIPSLHKKSKGDLHGMSKDL